MEKLCPLSYFIFFAWCPPIRSPLFWGLPLSVLNSTGQLLLIQNNPFFPPHQPKCTYAILIFKSFLCDYLAVAYNLIKKSHKESITNDSTRRIHQFPISFWVLHRKVLFFLMDLVSVNIKIEVSKYTWIKTPWCFKDSSSSQIICDGNG